MTAPSAQGLCETQPMPENLVNGAEVEMLLLPPVPDLRHCIQNVMDKLLAEIGRCRPSLPFREVPVPVKAIMVGTGDKFCLDGPCAEACTAETRSPGETLARIRACELAVVQALPNALARAGVPAQGWRVVKLGHDYSGHYSGFHINVQSRRHRAVDFTTNLASCLLTSPFFCSGGIGPYGLHTTQKLRSLRCLAAKDTRKDRPIVDTREESLADAGSHRIHISFGDCTMAQRNILGALGSTLLVIRMLEDGCPVGSAMALEDPLEAASQIDSDPTWSTPLRLASGHYASAIQVQEHFWACAQAFIRGRRIPWMHESVIIWRETLDRLKHDPWSLTTSLDVPIKLRLFGDVLRKKGVSWRDFSVFCGVIEMIRNSVDLRALPARGVAGFCREHMPHVPFSLADERLRAAGLTWRALPRIERLWHSIVSLDVAYHDIAPSGLYWTLRAQGYLGSTFLREQDVTHAMNNPPTNTRAKARGDAIRVLAGAGDKKAFASWNMVTAADKRMVLNEPTKPTGTWQNTARPTRAARSARPTVRRP